MFPVSDNKPAARFPIAVILLVLANCFVFYQELKLGHLALEGFVEQFGMIPARDFSGGIALAPYFTSMFLHGGFAHLLMNMWSFWIFGDNIEGEMGPARFLIFYLACGFLAAITHAFLNPGSEVPVVGASGAISGVMGAYLISFPSARIRMFTLLIFYPIFFEIPAFIFLILWFIGQLLSGTVALDQMAAQGQNIREVGGIAFFAHIGGFVSGIVLLPIFRRGRRAAR